MVDVSDSVLCGQCRFKFDYHELMSPAPAAAWPIQWLCQDCREELADEEDDAPDGSECECRSFCNKCV